MNTWTPLFSKVVDSSVWDEPDFVCKIFITMLAKKDADQVVRGTAYMIGRWARKTEKEVLEALRVLSSPDKKRLEPQPHEGRRIEKVEGGWLILNGQTYEELMRSLNRREYKTTKEREYRAAKKKGAGGPRETAYVKAHGDGDEKECDRLASPTYVPPTPEQRVVNPGLGPETNGGPVVSPSVDQPKIVRPFDV